jgi:hypothetical protein
MDPRKLGKLLATLRENGVTSVQFDADSNPVRIDFGAGPLAVPEGDVEVGEEEAEWLKSAPMGLAEAHRKILSTYAGKKKPAKGAKA